MGKGTVYLHLHFIWSERCIIEGNLLIVITCHVLVVITVQPYSTRIEFHFNQTKLEDVIVIHLILMSVQFSGLFLVQSKTFWNVSAVDETLSLCSYGALLIS